MRGHESTKALFRYTYKMHNSFFSPNKRTIKNTKVTYKKSELLQRNDFESFDKSGLYSFAAVIYT